MLKHLGATIQSETPVDTSDYREKLTKVSVWSEEDLKIFEESKKAFESPTPQQW